ncbi:MAG: hypothetical protein KTR31_09725 [Myxococcales bacterium]|nr:hypothetical protein [Myxococcales bacterium]
MRVGWFAACGLLACAEPQELVSDPEEVPPFVLTPDAGPSTGYFEVALDLTEGSLPDDLEGVAVTVAGLPALRLALDDGTLTFLVQGSPTSGPAQVQLLLEEEGTPIVVDEAIAFTGPTDPRFERVFAVGASLTQGVQDGVPTFHGTLHSPALQVARGLSAFFPIPLPPEGLIPSLQLDDVGPPPECHIPDASEAITENLTDVLAGLANEDGTGFSYRNARLDPDVQVQNLAVGGLDLDDIVEGPSDFGLTFLSHLVYAPSGGVADPVVGQLELLQSLEPTLVISTDMYGNDLIPTILGGGGIDPSDATPPEELYPYMAELVDGLASTGAEVFLATLPRPSLLPLAEVKRARTIRQATETAKADGVDPKAAVAAALAEFDALIGEVDDITFAANDELRRLTSAHDNVHVVELSAQVDELMSGRLVVEDVDVGPGQWGGLVTLDGLHFTDTGYALVADFFLEAIDEALGTSTDRVDVAGVHAADPRSPAAVAAAGIDASLCAP